MEQEIMLLTEEEIEKILNHLQGWKLETDIEEMEELDYNNTVSESEIELFYLQAFYEALQYCYLTTAPTIQEEELTKTDPMFIEAVLIWTAGLLWRKYNIRATDQIDETNTLGYGDSLIIQAKGFLKPFRYIKFVAI